MREQRGAEPNTEEQSERLSTLKINDDIRYKIDGQWITGTILSRAGKANGNTYLGITSEMRTTRKEVLILADLYYINTLKRELVDTNAYKLQPSLSERVIVDGHGCHTALHFGVKAKENQDKVPTLYWLPKLHKKSYKARFIANSSSCTTTELSKLLTSCLTAVKNMLSNIVKRYMRDPVKTYFGLRVSSNKF